MNSTYLLPLANHLWQSSLFAGAAGLLTLVLRRNRARVRFWIWMAASLKFLLPLSVLIALGGQVQWRAMTEATQSNLSIVMGEVSQPFAVPPISARQVTPPLAASLLPQIFLVGWAIGFVGISAAWVVRWRRISAAVRAGSPIPMDLPIPVRSSAATFEPGVFGILRPVLLLPEGIFFRLTPGQLEAVIAHELCHVRHKDNLVALLHMSVETVFWFHPLVWWIGKRMVEERERSCDEEVVQLGSEPRVYAEGILNVCKLYVESPLVCAAGVTGANLKRRIEGILALRDVRDLDFGRKVLLATLGSLAIVAPIAIGVANAPRLRAQAALSTPAQAFEVASVKRSPPSNGPLQVRMGGGPGSITYTNVTLKACIQSAYRLKGYQVQVSGPDWINSERYTITAKASTALPREQMMPMLQALLADRFKMTFHRETKMLSGYALVLAKSGSKLKPVKNDDDVATEIGAGAGGGIKFSKATIAQLAGTLSREFNMPIEDSTGLNGFFSFTLVYAPSGVLPTTGGDDRAGDDSNAPSIFAAVQEQLGLKLEPRKTSVEILLVDHAERPSEN